MAESIGRPFDSYRTAITDPDHFFGRGEFIARMRQSPFEVRVLLGGRRLGKTSLLRAVEWRLLDHSSELLQQRSRDFSRWWHAEQGDGLVEIEQRIYAELIVQREGTAESLAAIASLPPGKVVDALQLLAGTGVIRQLDDERYEIGPRLFKEWILQQ